VTVGTLFGVVTLLGLERLVLSRLALLGSEVEDIAATAQHSARVSISGNDELSRLGDGINAMLGQLEAFHSETMEIERTRGEEAEAIARAEELASSRTRILAVSESLRKEIARHLHGSVQIKLILVLSRISRLGQASPDELAAEVAEIRQELELLIENDVRKISVQIYPDILRRGLVPSLESL
jgi:glucose-6-phosphate-specific signal transduction histidine kinase